MKRMSNVSFCGDKERREQIRWEGNIVHPLRDIGPLRAGWKGIIGGLTVCHSLISRSNVLLNAIAPGPSRAPAGRLEAFPSYVVWKSEGRTSALLSYMQAHTHTHGMSAHAHTRTHQNTHTHKHTLAHTHTHTHVLILYLNPTITLQVKGFIYFQTCDRALFKGA